MYSKVAKRGVSLDAAATPTHKLNSTFAVAVGEPPSLPTRRQVRTIWAPRPIRTDKGKVLGARVFDDRWGKPQVSVAVILNGEQRLSWRDAGAFFGQDAAQRLAALVASA